MKTLFDIVGERHEQIMRAGMDKEAVGPLLKGAWNIAKKVGGVVKRNPMKSIGGLATAGEVGSAASNTSQSMQASKNYHRAAEKVQRRRV